MSNPVTAQGGNRVKHYPTQTPRGSGPICAAASRESGANQKIFNADSDGCRLVWPPDLRRKRLRSIFVRIGAEVALIETIRRESE